jgi:DNA repair protein RadD
MFAMLEKLPPSTVAPANGPPQPKMVTGFVREDLQVPSCQPVNSSMGAVATQSYKPREYQEAAIESIFEYFQSGKTGNPLVVLPTGTGKSLVIGEFVRRVLAQYPMQRCVNITHVKELIAQNCATLLKQWPDAPAGVYSAGLGRKEHCYPITFAGVASAVKQPEKFGHVDLVLIDEAHLVSPKDNTMYQTLIAKFKAVNPYLKVIGFTATPYRLSQGMLTEKGGLFSDVCFDMSGIDAFAWLLTQGYLVPLVPRCTATKLDVSNVNVHAGEYVQKELQQAVDKDELTFATLKETLQLAGDRSHWLVFASGVDHAKHIRDMLDSLNVPATWVHAKMPSTERDANIKAFREGQYRAMVNNGILTTGFDYSAIDLICVLRPTQSPGLWVQMLGRGTRPLYPPGSSIDSQQGRLEAIAASEKKNCLVLDFAANTARLGPIDDPSIPDPKRKGKARPAPVKICDKCSSYNHTRARVCIGCGAEFKQLANIAKGASRAALISGYKEAPLEKPVVEVFDVTRVVYASHQKHGSKSISLRVSYYCGLRRFEEWVTIEYEGYARKRACDWWRARAKQQALVPLTVSDALSRLAELRTPTQIKVWVNKKFPEILGYSYGADQ